MIYESSFQWSVWISIISIGLLQVYVIYSSVFRYINLRYEIFNGYHVHYDEYKWITYLFNFQLFAIIGALGVIPLWFYNVLFSASSFFCNAFSPKFNRKGFQELALKRATKIINDRKLFRSNSLQSHDTKRCNCLCGLYYPAASILHVINSYLLLLPITFIEAWLIQIDRVTKEEISTNDIDFLVSNSLTTKIKWSVEYFNFLISLCVLSLQYPNLIWATNKLFSIAFNLIEFFIVLHILIDFPIIKIVIKNYLNCKTHVNDMDKTLAYSAILLGSSVIGNIFLLLTFFSIFQFALEKCVQVLLKSSYCNSFRLELTSSVNNIDQNPCQSNASSSALFSPDKSGKIKTTPYPFVFSALFFLFGIFVKGIIYYQYQEFRKESKLFGVYIIQSMILVILYIMFWFGISLKPKWSFSLKEIEKKIIFQNSSSQREESNYYKSLRGPLKTSQISLSSVSNTNLSFHSLQSQQTSNRIDYTSPDPYMGKCNSLKFVIQNKDNQDFTEYVQLSQHLPPTRIFKPIYSGLMSPKPIIEDRGDNKMPHNSYYKCSNSLSLMKSPENTRYEDTYQSNKKPKMGFTIQEETSNDNASSISDDKSSNITASPITDLNNKNISNGKFVTFRLDNNAEITALGSNSDSDESLTDITAEPSEAFLKELEGDGTEKIKFSPSIQEINSDFRDKFIFYSEPKPNDGASFLTASNQTKVSLL